MRRPTLGRAVKIGALFGAVEAITPLLGWLLGLAAGQFVQAVDHWIAFALLGAVGGRMALEAFRRDRQAAPEPEESAQTATLGAMLLTAVGTSIDAMAVGASMAFIGVDALGIALTVGVVTCAMATLGVLAGPVVGRRFGRYAEVAGGLVLIGLGTSILIGHLNAG